MALPASPPFIFFSKELFVMRVKSSAVESLLNEQFRVAMVLLRMMILLVRDVLLASNAAVQAGVDMFMFCCANNSPL